MAYDGNTFNWSMYYPCIDVTNFIITVNTIAILQVHILVEIVLWISMSSKENIEVILF